MKLVHLTESLERDNIHFYKLRLWILGEHSYVKLAREPMFKNEL